MHDSPACDTAPVPPHPITDWAVPRHNTHTHQSLLLSKTVLRHLKSTHPVLCGKDLLRATVFSGLGRKIAEPSPLEQEKKQLKTPRARDRPYTAARKCSSVQGAGGTEPESSGHRQQPRQAFNRWNNSNSSLLECLPW